MDKHIIETITQELEQFEKNESNLPEKTIRKSVQNIFKPLLNIEGFTPNKDSMKRHGLDYIATKGKGKNKQTIAIIHRKDKSIVTRDEIKGLVAAGSMDDYNKILIITNAKVEKNALDLDSNIYDDVRCEVKNFTQLKNWIASIETGDDESEVAKVLQNCTQKLIELIASNPGKTLAELEWRDVERIVAELFNGLGYKTQLTPASKDGGKDVIIEFLSSKSNKSYIVEIKHWRSMQKVGKKSVTEFLKVIAKEKREGGVFLSTYGFTENLIESLTTIEREKVKFGEEDKIHSLCHTYVKKKAGLWIKDLNLDKVLFEKTK